MEWYLQGLTTSVESGISSSPHCPSHVLFWLVLVNWPTSFCYSQAQHISLLLSLPGSSPVGILCSRETCGHLKILKPLSFCFVETRDNWFHYVCVSQIQHPGSSPHPKDENQASHLLHHALLHSSAWPNCHRNIPVLASLHWVIQWLDRWKTQCPWCACGQASCWQPHSWAGRPQLQDAYLLRCLSLWLQSQKQNQGIHLLTEEVCGWIRDLGEQHHFQGIQWAADCHLWQWILHWRCEPGLPFCAIHRCP